MTERFQLPASADEADAMLGELGQLVIATEWRRAALVYAMVVVTTHGGDRSKTRIGVGRETPERFAKRGIVGLRSPETIRRYVRAWQRAVDDGLAEPARLGEEIDIPDAEWRYYFTLVGPYLKDESDDDDDEYDDLDQTDDGLGLGECPPRASDIIYEPPLPPAPERRREPIDPALENRRALHGLEILTGGLERQLHEITGQLKRITDWPDDTREAELRRIDRIRHLLNTIEQAVRGGVQA